MGEEREEWFGDFILVDLCGDLTTENTEVWRKRKQRVKAIELENKTSDAILKNKDIEINQQTDFTIC